MSTPLSPLHFAAVSVIVVAFAIASIVLGARGSDICNTPAHGVNVSGYLLGSGFAALVEIFARTFALAVRDEVSKEKIEFSIHAVASAFGVCWFAVGAVALFSNVPCLTADIPMISYALFVWVVSILSLLLFLAKMVRDWLASETAPISFRV